MPTFTNSTAPGADHAIVGVADEGIGIHGTSSTSTGAGGVSTSGIGVHGVSIAGPGVRGDAERGVAVFGASKTSTGIGGLSESGWGVHGVSTSGAGVVGNSETADGVFGQSKSGRGVVGVAAKVTAVEGNSREGAGVWGSSQTGEGVHGETRSTTSAAIAAFHNNPSSGGAAIYGKKDGPNGHAGYFDGNVHVTRTLTAEGDVLLANADCAEDFDIAASTPIEPGTVMVLDCEGALHPSERAYDKRVAGVVSGAGAFKPGIVLDRRPSDRLRSPVALLGKVFCKVDARYAPIEVGDLLTSSPTRGHAMKANDPQKAFGAVIGKAMARLDSGSGLIPILVALQ